MEEPSLLQYVMKGLDFRRIRKKFQSHLYSSKFMFKSNWDLMLYYHICKIMPKLLAICYITLLLSLFISNERMARQQTSKLTLILRFSVCIYSHFQPLNIHYIFKLVSVKSLLWHNFNSIHFVIKQVPNGVSVLYFCPLIWLRTKADTIRSHMPCISATSIVTN